MADLLGYGTSNTFETKAAAAPAGNTDVKSLNRTGGADSNNNSADFTLSAAITPQGSAGGTAWIRPVIRRPTPTPVRRQNHRRNPGHRRRQPAGRHQR